MNRCVKLIGASCSPKFNWSVDGIVAPGISNRATESVPCRVPGKKGATAAASRQFRASISFLVRVVAD